MGNSCDCCKKKISEVKDNYYRELGRESDSELMDELIPWITAENFSSIFQKTGKELPSDDFCIMDVRNSIEIAGSAIPYENSVKLILI